MRAATMVVVSIGIALQPWLLVGDGNGYHGCTYAAISEGQR